MRPSEEKHLQLILDRMALDDSVDAPADALRYARNLMRSRLSEERPTLLRRVLAVLQAEIQIGDVAFGERSAGEAKARQILFQTEDHAIDLRIKPDGDAFVIHGQILGDGFDNGSAVLSDGSQENTFEIDRNSEFRSGKIAPGEYSLTLKGSETEISIDTLRID